MLAAIQVGQKTLSLSLSVIHLAGSNEAEGLHSSHISLLVLFIAVDSCAVTLMAGSSHGHASLV